MSLVGFRAMLASADVSWLGARDGVRRKDAEAWTHWGNAGAEIDWTTLATTLGAGTSTMFRTFLFMEVHSELLSVGRGSRNPSLWSFCRYGKLE